MLLQMSNPSLMSFPLVSSKGLVNDALAIYLADHAPFIFYPPTSGIVIYSSQQTSQKYLTVTSSFLFHTLSIISRGRGFNLFCIYFQFQEFKPVLPTGNNFFLSPGGCHAIGNWRWSGDIKQIAQGGCRHETRAGVKRSVFLQQLKTSQHPFTNAEEVQEYPGQPPACT